MKRANRFGKLRTWFSAALALALMIAARTCLAQYDTGSVVGIIQDASGAVIPGATVTVVNKDTGASYAVTAGAAGEYEVPSLHTGNYKLTAEHAGFRTAVADNI